MKLLTQLVFGLAILGAPLFASGADVAVLRNGFSIRHERREVVGSVTRLYLNADSNGYVDVPTSEIDRFEKDLSVPAARPGSQSMAVPTSEIDRFKKDLSVPATKPGSLPMADVINTVSGRHHLDPDLINSVIHAESGFNPRAVSPKGAQGLMQLMPRTASRLGVVNSFDPGDNLEGGTRYLRELLERYNFDLIKALAAYNAGPQRVEQYHGVPPYYETQAYVARIIRDFNRKKLAERKAAGLKSASYRKSPAPAVKELNLPDTQEVSR